MIVIKNSAGRKTTIKNKHTQHLKFFETFYSTQRKDSIIDFSVQKSVKITKECIIKLNSICSRINNRDNIYLFKKDFNYIKQAKFLLLKDEYLSILEFVEDYILLNIGDSLPDKLENWSKLCLSLIFDYSGRKKRLQVKFFVDEKKYIYHEINNQIPLKITSGVNKSYEYYEKTENDNNTHKFLLNLIKSDKINECVYFSNSMPWYLKLIKIEFLTQKKVKCFKDIEVLIELVIGNNTSLKAHIFLELTKTRKIESYFGYRLEFMMKFIIKLSKMIKKGMKTVYLI